MKHLQALKAAAVAAFTMVGGAVAQVQITIPTVTVGDVGNAADGSGFGAVGYEYQIGKYEVTNAQYAAFLNAVAKTDTFTLYNTSMAGIARTGDSGNYSYTVNNTFANKPVTHVSFWDATRFANWLNNGQGSASTETGSYTLVSVTNPVNSSVTRNAGANWVVASENEWYKAAYYNGSSSGYTLYPTRSNTAPTAENPPGGANSANFSGGPGTVTDVGAYMDSGSHYGTFDQGGNLFEWNESISSISRGLRGGSWFGSGGEFNLRSSIRYDIDATDETNLIGFRVASLAPIPEPSTFGGAMGVMALGVVMMRRRKARGTL